MMSMKAADVCAAVAVGIVGIWASKKEWKPREVSSSCASASRAITSVFALCAMKPLRTKSA